MRSLAALALLGASVLTSIVETGAAAQEEQRDIAAADGLSFQERLDRLYAEQRRTSANASVGSPPSSPTTNVRVLPPIEAASPAPKPPPSREDVYFDALNASIAECIKRDDYHPNALCFPKLSPAKCEGSALAMIGGRSDERRTWFLCVRSCATASWWSRTFGECAAP